MTTNTNKPLDTIRDGSLKATLWKNTGEKGTFYSVDLSRTYKDEKGNYQDARTFRGTELLRIARLANIAYDEILIHRANDGQQDADNGGSS